MLYSEFIEGTGCKENYHNYKVYKDLEIMYMNSDLTKQDIYEYGKKLVDNSKSEEEIRFENELNQELKELKEEYKAAREEVNRYRTYYKENPDRFWKDQIKWYTDLARSIKVKISGIKFILNT